MGVESSPESGCPTTSEDVDVAELFGVQKAVVIGRRFFKSSASFDFCLLDAQAPEFIMAQIMPSTSMGAQAVAELSRLKREVKLGDKVQLRAPPQVLGGCPAWAPEVVHVEQQAFWEMGRIVQARTQRDELLGLQGKRESRMAVAPSPPPPCTTRDPVSPHGGGGPHAADCAAFAAWLLAMRDQGRGPLPAPGSAGYVLDVAGGGGELSLLLVMAGIRSVVLDPRKAAGNLTRRLRKRMRKSGVEPFQVVSLPLPSSPVENPTTPEEQEVLSLLEGCYGILALHPDEAVDAAVDCAIRLRKPFACVPCCVFARRFPHRRLRDGAAVTTREQLVQYLVEKSTNIHEDTLTFCGANKVLWTDWQER